MRRGEGQPNSCGLDTNPPQWSDFRPSSLPLPPSIPGWLHGEGSLLSSFASALSILSILSFLCSCLPNRDWPSFSLLSVSLHLIVPRSSFSFLQQVIVLFSVVCPSEGQVIPTFQSCLSWLGLEPLAPMCHDISKVVLCPVLLSLVLSVMYLYEPSKVLYFLFPNSFLCCAKLKALIG